MPIATLGRETAGGAARGRPSRTPTTPAPAPARRGVVPGGSRPAGRSGPVRPRAAVRPVLTPVPKCSARGEPLAHRPVRLTTRGRLLVVLVAAALAALAFTAGRASGAAASPGRTGAAAATVLVRQGDTLWSIARKVAPGRDPRETVEQLRRLNHLGGAGVPVGRRLVVPG